MVLNIRLGLLDAAEGAVCQIPRSSQTDGVTDLCLCRLDGKLKHPFLCKSGPARFRPHRGLAETFAHCAKEAGAHVDLERACPDLYT
eukprot:7003690-Karenia_brevis.AAC.1